ncbi:MULTISPECIES: fatty acyl-AMP ligase [unclassified Mycobacterium]|uniref:fatty acyl-AMP ligase n=1 Tax=unclassified Mycobacterium TaxID=2642494 RepID=UPI000740120F|nr:MULTISPECIES: fatty acyl-AMP ligase [unclassified Mycobacterium]KUH85445.1 fatty-acid--CoA ligase [Mycobacterium sp. GA-1999]KUH91305.1 fatty-acid--CoA ligase [Mycobacterium sp. GA-0227b]KUH96440.1 fatty-acid--CoA ligase [Mycobacterium sp. IS-1556]
MGERTVTHDGLLRIEDCLDADGHVAVPAGVNLISLIDRNIANVGDAPAYRYLDYTGNTDGRVTELTWRQLGARLRAVAAHLQRVAQRGDRVAILAPQGLDYVTGFFAAIKAGAIAVPLFAPELQGHAQRLGTALRDSEPSVVVTTAAAAANVHDFLAGLDGVPAPRVVLLDDITDSGDDFEPVPLRLDDISHLQYTSGATRPPVGVEITHRAVGTNLIQMILSIDLLDRRVHGVSWLPLFHDMGLSMIGFPAVYGGHSTLMSPTAFIRRPQRWIKALSDGAREGRVVTAAPNFAYEYAAQRGLPAPGDHLDLSKAVLIVGSEPVSIEAIETFNAAFTPYGLPLNAFRPSYGIAEATLFVSTIAPDAHAGAVYFDREQLAEGHAVPVAAGCPGAVAHVSCGQVARSQWAVVADPDTGAELPDGRIGEIWLHGDNLGKGYWGRPDETRRAFGARLTSRLPSGSHAEGVALQANWLRTGDLGVHREGELYVTGRRADMIVIDGKQHYPQDVEATAEDASAMARPGHVTAFTVPGPDGEGALVIVAERASGTARLDPAPAIEAIGNAVVLRHGIAAADIRFVAAGAIPRTTSGKLARGACRAEYIGGKLRR